MSVARALTRSAIVACALAAVAPPASAALRPRLAAATEAARRVAPALGVHVVDLETGETVYGYQGERERIVASNAKLFTTAAAVDRLDPGFFFETRVQARGKVVDGTLLGDLSVVGSGDPNISGRHTEDDPLRIFRGWARLLSARGVRRIGGDLILVDGLYDRERVHPDWPADQLHKWYEAPVSALSFNDNCVVLRVIPGNAPGRKARVEVQPDVGVVEVQNLAKTTGNARRQSIIVDRRRGSRLIEVSGWVYNGNDEFVTAVTVEEPAEYFGLALRRALEDEGITHDGQIRVVRSLPPGGWWDVVTHRTDFQTTLNVVNKRSQNFFAESLLKLLGALFCNDGSWRGGLKVVREFLAEVGLPEGTYTLADGSGMSRKNRFSPAQITTLLRWMFFHRNGREFIQSLPYSGEAELRWEERLTDPPYKGNVMAKTGGLSGVSTLSGYAKARSGKLYAFSILCNQIRGAWHAARAQDEILKTLIDNG